MDEVGQWVGYCHVQVWWISLVFLYRLLVQCHLSNGKTSYLRQVYSSVQSPRINKTLVMQTWTFSLPVTSTLHTHTFFCRIFSGFFSAVLPVFRFVVVVAISLISIFLSSLLLWKDTFSFCSIWMCFCFQTYWKQQRVNMIETKAFSMEKFSHLW